MQVLPYTTLQPDCNISVPRMRWPLFHPQIFAPADPSARKPPTIGACAWLAFSQSSVSAEMFLVLGTSPLATVQWDREVVPLLRGQ